MTDKDFTSGTFEGMTLARLDNLQKGMDVLASKVDAMCQQCVNHTIRLNTLETKAAGIVAATSAMRWFIGTVLTILGLLGTAVWLLRK